LSHEYWQRRFSGAVTVLNQAVTVNSTPMTIIGVAPPNFAGVTATRAPDLFAPLAMKARLTPTWDDLDNRRSRWVNIVGRLKPGLTMDAAKAPRDVVYQQHNEYELKEVPAFASGSANFRERFRAKKLVLHEAAHGLSDLRQ